ncbi:ROK family protein [Bacillus sp. FJAT-49732]|uniref:ROK family protein n=1 Tax=Lederbergia citrisecunda TaxID=2833583 RepID=A0A942TRJ3_9BACI|nr:ROK family protein [Lederbergia citrisecunda]MBS4200549.1 ROK family protein [Lederbergia citrisecunda]
MCNGVIGVDIGGTNIRVGFLDENLQLVRKETALQNQFSDADDMFTYIREMISRVDPDGKANKIGIAMPVPWREDVEFIVDATNIPFLEKMSVEKIRSFFPGYAVYFENDVNVIALLEARYGASKEYKHSMYITISTGIGSGIVLNNKIFHGAHGYAGEIGSMIVSNFDRSLESLCSGQALEHASKNLYGNEATTSLLFEKYQAKDKNAVETIELWIEHFSSAIASLMQTIDPDMFVFGGAVIYNNQWLIGKIIESAEKKLLLNLRGKINIVMTNFGPDAGIIGAGNIAMEKSKGE